MRRARITTALSLACAASFATVARAQRFEAPPPLPSPAFTNVASTDHFDVVGDVGPAVEPLAYLAEDARSRMRAWLGLIETREERRVRIYVCGDLAAVRVLERLHSVPARDAFRGDRPFHGRCYPEAGLIVVPARAPDEVRWQVCHEVAHVVFHEIVGRNVEIVNEGLAELVPYWILYSAAPTPETLNARYPLYEGRLARAVLAREVPRFVDFAWITPGRFYADSNEWLHYALAWKFVKLLVESDDRRIAGRFTRFLRCLGDGNEVFPALRSVYDSEFVEAEWLASVEGEAPWKPIFGAWIQDGGTLVGRSLGRASAACVQGATLDAERAFAIQASIVGPIAHDASYGFVLDQRGEDDFVYVAVRPSRREVAIARRAAGAWERFDVQPVDERCELAPRDAATPLVLRVSIDAAGSFVLTSNGATIARGALGAMRGGRAGVMLERCASDARGDPFLEVRFKDVR